MASQIIFWLVIIVLNLNCLFEVTSADTGFWEPEAEATASQVSDPCNLTPDTCQYGNDVDGVDNGICLYYDEAQSQGRESRAYARLPRTAAQNHPWQKLSGDGEREHLVDEDEDRESGTFDEDQARSLQNEEDFRAFWSKDADADTIRQRQARIMLSYMDNATDPCADFYQYACGNWESRNPIPRDKNAYGTFEMLRESLDRVLREMLLEPMEGEGGCGGADASVKAKHLYQSCMNNDILKERAETPLMEMLDDFGGWPFLSPEWDGSQFCWMTQIARLRLYNNGVLISVRVSADINNSDVYVIQLDQSGLGLLTREAFLEPANQMYLSGYRNYVIQITTLLGVPLDNATIQADEMLDFEVKLAKITIAPPDERGGAHSNSSDMMCHHMSLGDLRRFLPDIDWSLYLDTVLGQRVDPRERVVVCSVRYFQEMVRLLDDTEPRILANYLLWRFVQHRVNNLDDRFIAANTRLDHILFGRDKIPPRWKSCVTQVNNNMGMALGAMFVDKFFDEFSKNDATHMTEAVMESFRDLLNLTDWIDDDTKEFAYLKVDTMLLRIGYPDFILDKGKLNQRYQDVHIEPDTYFENMLNLLRHRVGLEQEHFRTRVVNKTQWDTAPTVVNGYYSRNKNQIMFPACILQPPFYHRLFPKSLNFGGIGVVIGHEVTHGFDDKGRLFDQNGNLHRWWSDTAIEEFHTRAKCLIDQYSKFVVKEVNILVDGVNTQGENIADNGGIKQAYHSYHRWLDAHDGDQEGLPGMDESPDQLFFLNFAQVWCTSSRPETARSNLKTGVHAPGKFRVIGTLSNSEDFARAYNCSLGSPMNPELKCSVW